MSDTNTAIETSSTSASPLAPLHHTQTATTRNERRRVTGRMKVALDSMVFEGLSFNQAATNAGLTVRTMRYALERPHVLRYLREQKQVFRASVSASNIHKLAELRDTAGNAMAQLGAIKVLEQIDNDPQSQSNVVRSPGFVIVVNAGPNSTKPLIELNPLPREAELGALGDNE